MKVYIVTEGSYSDYRICSVFTSYGLACEYVQKYGGDIEDWDADIAHLLPEGHFLYGICMDRAGGSSIPVRQESYATPFLVLEKNVLDGDLYLRGVVSARYPQHAIKIANEKRIQLIDTGGWK